MLNVKTNRPPAHLVDSMVTIHGSEASKLQTFKGKANIPSILALRDAHSVSYVPSSSVQGLEMDRGPTPDHFGSLLVFGP